MPLSASQIDKLGQRLGKSPSPIAEDLDLLDQYERSFEAALSQVVIAIRGELGLNPTTRPMKTARSIVAKVGREHTALSRMQDIAGCRLVVEDVLDQDEVVDRLQRLPWDSCKVLDRRLNPSYGYRAVHLVVRADGRLIEIQVRTRLQDLWAQISEKLADMFGLEVKYGGGPPRVVEVLARTSRLVSKVEVLQLAFEDMRSYKGDDEIEMELQALETDARALIAELVDELSSLLITLSA